MNHELKNSFIYSFIQTEAISFTERGCEPMKCCLRCGAIVSAARSRGFLKKEERGLSLPNFCAKNVKLNSVIITSIT